MHEKNENACLKGERSLGRPRRMSEDNIKTDLKEKVFQDLN
jgi:hypothetical protein